MSELTRAQLRALMVRAAEVIKRSQELRRKLEEVLEEIERTGHVSPSADEVAPKRKASK